VPLLWLWASAAGAAPSEYQQVPSASESSQSAVIYVVRRRWHIDIGFAAADLESPLNSLRSDFPGVRYLFFGFGDERYLLAKNRNGPVLLAALWPGRGLMLATGLGATPQDGFGENNVIGLVVTRAQQRSAQAFVWRSLRQEHDSVAPVSPGPYDGSLYYAAVPRYSAFHTCNTWAAETLRAAALPISRAVIFAGQLWPQVRAASLRDGYRPISMVGFSTGRLAAVLADDGGGRSRWNDYRCLGRRRRTTAADAAG